MNDHLFHYSMKYRRRGKTGSHMLLPLFVTVVVALSVDSILNEHKQLTQLDKTFEGKVLAYVTPWSRHGYEIAKTCPSKFDFISPVWFNIVPMYS
jgi:hypothetical protein